MQKARVAAERAYKSLAPGKAKRQALKEWLIVALHACQPPDRVGVTRRLRLGMTLKRSGEGYTLDLTSARSHKTSRFYGPSISSMSAMFNEPLSLYLTDLEYTSAGNLTPYLFHPTDDTSRCVTSSQWSGVVKAALKKHSPTRVAPPPKLLRASFITWLRDSTDAPEVLKAAAKSMRCAHPHRTTRPK